MKQKSTGNARQRQSRQSTAPPTYRLEIAVPFGLTEIAQTEIEQRLAGTAVVRRTEGDRILCDYAGDLSALLRLQTVSAVYLIAAFAVPRPRALLGEAHLRTLLERISSVQRLVPPDTYQTLSLSAAGSTSPVMTRLKEEVASRTGLNVVPRDGDLQLRLRRSHSGTGWEVLIRLSPRPLATRAWRVCNMEGALNGAVAHAMVLLTQPRPGDVFLNPGCGSGTVLIERAAAAPAASIIGVDIDPRALECALWNIAASRYGDRIELHSWDARHLPLPDRLSISGELGDVNALLSSPVLRARQTAEVLAGVLPGVSIEEDCNLCELHWGEADGLSWHAYEKTYGAFDLVRSPNRPFFSGGDSWQDFLSRVGTTLDRLAVRFEGQTVVAVSHSAFIMASILVIFAIPRPGTGARLDPAYTSLTEWRVSGARWQLVCYNNAGHLL